LEWWVVETPGAGGKRSEREGARVERREKRNSQYEDVTEGGNDTRSRAIVLTKLQNVSSDRCE
jgi:hypothetical protein